MTKTLEFEALYQKNYMGVKLSLTKLLQDESAAEDCAHEAFTKAWAHWTTWKPIATRSSWLYRIAKNTAISYTRHRKIRTLDELIRRTGRPILWAEDPRLNTDSKHLRELIVRLPRTQAQAVILRYYHGYTNRAIGLKLGVPERTISSRLRVARIRLKEILKEDEMRGDSTLDGLMRTPTGLPCRP